MLNKLLIQNFAIIQSLDITFSNGLTIITGETGAGKSILLGALSLILGERAESSMLLNPKQKCIIEAEFSQNNSSVSQYLSSQSLDDDSELVIRREISSNGKSRAFINDTPVTLQQLRTLALLIVDLNQQFDSMELREEDFQRQVVDAIAHNEDMLGQYRLYYKNWQKARKELEALEQRKMDFNKELDYNQFLFDELDELNLTENELENIEHELQLLNNAEAIKTTLTGCVYTLEEGEAPLVPAIKQLHQQLQPYKELDSNISSVADRLLSCQVELKDIGNELNHINNNLHFDASRAQQLNDRLAAGYKLLKKHAVSTTAQLLEIKEQLQDKLSVFLSIDEEIETKKKELGNQLDGCNSLAKQLSTKRKSAAPKIQAEVNELLCQVGMPNASIRIVIEDAQLNLNGTNNIEFLFDANKSERYQPLGKVASGGELSRLMLCIKTLVAGKIDLATMIFDEIDTGISGEAAKQVGILLKTLSKNKQVLCITHQPQIAGKASEHIFVYKTLNENKVETRIRKLSQEERITAIAQMLSGEKPTAAALANAREMVMN